MESSKTAGRLKQLRESAGYTQKDVSVHLNVSRSAYANYERGERTPASESLIRLASLYNVPVDYIMGFESAQETLAAKNQNEYALLELFRSLTPADQKELLEYARYRKIRSENISAK